MSQYQAQLVELYIPLLLHDDPRVRERGGLILYTTYGEEAVRHLRGLLAKADADGRQQLRAALDALARHQQRGGAGAPPFSGLEVSCLGVLRVAVAGVSLLGQLAERDRGRAGSHKVRAVLAALVQAGGRGATREALAEAVWGPKGDGGNGLGRTLISLRTLIAEAGGEDLAAELLLLSEDRCLLHPDYVRSDVEVFERLCGLAAETEVSVGLPAAAELYRQAMELYRGPYMADVPCAWGALLERRTLLANDYLNVVERLAKHSFEQGRYHECVALCGVGVAEDPAADDITGWLLRAYSQLGHLAELEHAYRHYLRAAGVRPDAVYDPVVRTYHDLKRTLAVG